jgi:hypothetical protein
MLQATYLPQEKPPVCRRFYELFNKKSIPRTSLFWPQLLAAAFLGWGVFLCKDRNHKKLFPFLYRSLHMEAKLQFSTEGRILQLAEELWKRYAFGERVEVVLEEDGIKIRPLPTQVRAGWHEAFYTMRKNEEDTLLLEDIPEDEAWEL